MNWVYVYIITIIGRTNILLSLLFGRVLFASAILSILMLMIIFARRNNLVPAIRSYLWALCIPALFIPFERSVVIIMRGQMLELPQILDMYLILPVYIWLLVFIICVIKMYRERRKIIRLLKMGEIKGCAAYYYKFRSHIYTPPNFNDVYAEDEREMLLAHEQQHIKQRDPLLFLLLQGLQYVFWFNPLIHKAVQYIRHDRELLCDERVTSCYPKLNYGRLLLSEAQKALPIYPIAGIVSSTAGTYERIFACTRPFSKNKRTVVAVAFIAVVLFLFGAVGFTRPIVYHPMETMIVCNEGFEKFVTQDQGNIIINEDLYWFAISEGFESGDELALVVFQVRRPSVVASSSISRRFTFVLSELKSGDIIFPYYDVNHSLRSLWGMLYRIL